MVGDEDVEVAEGFQRAGDESLSIFGRRELLLDWAAEFRATTFCGEGVSLIGGGAIAEGDARPGLTEEANGGCADTA